MRSKPIKLLHLAFRGSARGSKAPQPNLLAENRSAGTLRIAQGTPLPIWPDAQGGRFGNKESWCRPPLARGLKNSSIDNVPLHSVTGRSLVLRWPMCTGPSNVTLSLRRRYLLRRLLKTGLKIRGTSGELWARGVGHADVGGVLELLFDSGCEVGRGQPSTVRELPDERSRRPARPQRRARDS